MGVKMDDLAALQILMLALIFAVLVRIYVMGMQLLKLRKQAARSREILPLHSVDKIQPGQTALITARVQRVPFEPQRVFIGAAGDKLGAGAWRIDDIRIANLSQFEQSGGIPGDMFATQTPDSYVNFDVVPVFADVEMVVTYVGDNPEGARFTGAMVGVDASDPKLRKPRRRTFDERRFAAPPASAPGAN